MTKIATWVRSLGLRSGSGVSLLRLRNRARIQLRDAGDWFCEAYSNGRDAALRLTGRDTLTVVEQRERLIEFYERYEDLVGILCDAARYEDSTHFEDDYRAAQSWMAKSYPPMRAHLLAHLKLDPADDSLGLRFTGRPTDAFEALYTAPTLQQAISLDQGDMIDRLQRTRSALNRYGDHLRRQSRA